MKDSLYLWQQKLEHLRQQEAVSSDPEQKFTLKTQIEDALRNIRELQHGDLVVGKGAEDHWLASSASDDSRRSRVPWECRDTLLLQEYLGWCAEYDQFFNDWPQFDESRLREFFHCSGLAAEDDQGRFYLTDAGVILCCKREHMPRDLYHVHVKFTDKRGEDAHEEFFGCVLHMYGELLQRLKPLCGQRGLPETRGRMGGEEIVRDYPFVAIVEALVNFLIHRDYRSDDVGFIAVYEDRIEFLNPGGSDFPVDQLMAIDRPLRPKYTRNQRLIEALNKARLNQREGGGILRIRQELERNGSRRPDGNLGLEIISEPGNHRFMLTIYRRQPPRRAENEIVGPVLSGDLRSPIASDDRHPISSSLHQLPAPPGDFVGRDNDLQTLTVVGVTGAAITGVRGMGGIGKTALALKAAAILCERYPDAQFFVDLRGSREDPLTPAEALSQVIRGYHPMAQLPKDEVELRALYRSVLHGKRALVLLDDARDEAQVEPLLPPASCYALITSRRRLLLPGLRASDLGTLPEADARSLLLEIAPRLGEAAGVLAGLCGCLPLALRVAASQAASHPLLDVQEYVWRLREARGRLAEVEASLSLSHDLLPADMKTRWTALAVFPADFDAAAAATVFACEEAKAREALDELVGSSLVQWDEKTGRLRLHDLVRAYADSLVESGIRGRLQERHAEHYLGVLSAADALYLEGGEGVDRGLALADREWPNILAGQRWAAGSDEKTAGRMCSRYPAAGTYVLDLRLRPGEMIRWLESALEAARKAGDRAAEGAHLGNLGLAYAALDQPQKAIEHYEKQQVIAREIGDRRGEGAALGNLGNAYADLGQPQKAIEYHEQALGIDREIGDRRGEGNALGNLGVAYADLGQPQKAIEYYEQALAIAREIGDRRGEGAVLGNLGTAYADLGQPQKAIEYYENHLAIDREIGDRQGEGNVLGNLGNTYADLSQPQKAIEYYEKRLAIAREIGDRRGEGNALGNLGNAYAALGRPQKAIEYYDKRLTIAREIGDRRGEGAVLGNLGMSYDNLGQSQKAIEHYEKHLAIAREIGDRLGEASACWNMGDALAKAGDLRRAVELMQVCVDFEREIGHPDVEKHAARVESLRRKSTRG